MSVLLKIFLMYDTKAILFFFDGGNKVDFCDNGLLWISISTCWYYFFYNPIVFFLSKIPYRVVKRIDSFSVDTLQEKILYVVLLRPL